MSLFLQIALGVLVAGGIGLGAWKHHETVVRNDAKMHDQSGATLSTGSTNDDLDKDMITIDGQLKAVDESSVSIDQTTK